ncbi:hypothetical protein HGI30_05895 [Paenibacillus albicereus]|uniref:Uncharacterized protein n=1 Tax=Paenibacillus albicereus TaxID=2726185 RepID=A0A6H2GUN8_9BACL|nr:hypothetical protein [Paenibacillus albicereus]QJC51141.1 hypothetical protein HGI30_05895 [Paenibacillus albicereus]
MSMKPYCAPAVLGHQSVEFGTVNISNNFFYKWCKSQNFAPFICRLFYGPGGPGGPCGCGTKPLGYLDRYDGLK